MCLVLGDREQCLDSTGLASSSSVPLNLTDGETEAERVGMMGVTHRVRVE